ncbi:hypothetical protein [Corallococcus sp. AB038B]|uniref:hypothetical protein n=1 Tax=Corallococcus sp. AB038B TaxID=2316718 RepID=UPI001315475A|nr:hypothetical protein [Corallococcus sp. AB038B]
MGIPIDKQVLDYAFPTGIPAPPPGRPPPFERANPVHNQKLQFIGAVRELLPKTKHIHELAQLGQTGWKMIGLPSSTQFWQITVADNSNSPQKTYTALVPGKLGQSGITKNQLVFIELRGVALGSFSAWIATFLELAS